MSWNWQLPGWPRFRCDKNQLADLEKRFLLGIGSDSAYLKNLSEVDSSQFIVEILVAEGLDSSKIEGELLDRQSLQSSIKRHFGLKEGREKERKKEARVAKLLTDVYRTFEEPLTHEMLFKWHEILFKGSSEIGCIGRYRVHAEPMQIVSNKYGDTKVYFEAPPSKRVPQEMDNFIKWFNDSRRSEPILVRAALAHLYFENIHPFEDGNGRIGRLLVEKVFSQGVDRPVLIALSKSLEKHRKEYYLELGKCNRSLDANEWVRYFAKIAIEAQSDASLHLSFLMQKSKMMHSLEGKINARQEKVLVRMFAEGPSGFKGGLSAENYRAITKTSRATATRDLADLVKIGALIKVGERRHTRYSLNLGKKY